MLGLTAAAQDQLVLARHGALDHVRMEIEATPALRKPSKTPPACRNLAGTHAFDAAQRVDQPSGLMQHAGHDAIPEQHDGLGAVVLP